MKIKFMIAVIALFISSNAQAAKQRPFTIAGLWQATTTIGDVFIHHSIDLRDGNRKENAQIQKDRPLSDDPFSFTIQKRPAVKLVFFGAGRESRTPILSLASIHNSRYTIPARFRWHETKYIRIEYFAQECGVAPRLLTKHQ